MRIARKNPRPSETAPTGGRVAAATPRRRRGVDAAATTPSVHGDGIATTLRCNERAFGRTSAAEPPFPHRPRHPKMVRPRVAPPRPHGQAVPRAVAQPAEPRHLQAAVDRGRGPRHRPRVRAPRRALGRHRLTITGPDGQRREKPLELFDAAEGRAARPRGGRRGRGAADDARGRVRDASFIARRRARRPRGRARPRTRVWKKKHRTVAAPSRDARVLGRGRGAAAGCDLDIPRGRGSVGTARRTPAAPLIRSARPRRRTGSARRATRPPRAPPRAPGSASRRFASRRGRRRPRTRPPRR